jgi:hypothetical protein
VKLPTGAELGNKQNSGLPKLLHWSHSVCLDLTIALLPNSTIKHFSQIIQETDVALNKHKFVQKVAKVDYYCMGLFMLVFDFLFVRAC